MARIIQVDEVVDAKEGDLRVWWIRNPPGSPEYHLATDPTTAWYILDALANNDLRDARVWANISGLEVYHEGEWEEWYDEQGYTIDELETAPLELVRVPDPAVLLAKRGEALREMGRKEAQP